MNKISFLKTNPLALRDFLYADTKISASTRASYDVDSLRKNEIKPVKTKVDHGTFQLCQDRRGYQDVLLTKQPYIRPYTVIISSVSS